MARKSAADELEPLRQMCRAGRLFDAQDWVRQGKPVTPKEPPPKNARNGPLCIAVTRGFHSLVQVLLEAGAPTSEGNYHALRHAVELRRIDLIELLIRHGAKVQDVSMQTVIGTWDRKMVDLFIANGANLVDDLPIAWGLVNKIRTALGVFKQYVGQHPQLRDQVNIALRHHAKEGNVKWVSLMLWAGADPWALGPYDAPDYDARTYYDDDEDGPLQYSAVELAVLHEQVEVLKLKKLLTPPDPAKPESTNILRGARRLRSSSVVKLLLERGHLPASYADRCSHVISGLLLELSSHWSISRSYWATTKPTRDIDTYRAQEVLEVVGLLLAKGARWLPTDEDEVKRVRKSLLKMAPKCTYEFVQMVHEHQAARRRDLEELIRPKSMASLLTKRCRKIAALVAGLPEELPLDAPPE